MEPAWVVSLPVESGQVPGGANADKRFAPPLRSLPADRGTAQGEALRAMEADGGGLLVSSTREPVPPFLEALSLLAAG